ncbi:MAG: hypothetical protein JXA71_08965 [Chitinispirillaceae bacterium]|nr:hypothetical protein [Chitinispirillaceae bacterium]
MSHHHRSSREKYLQERPGIVKELWDSFWNGPSTACPKCGSLATEYYDPFLFAPVRTFTGKRRIKCTACHFIWRPSRGGKSLWDRFKPVV